MKAQHWLAARRARHDDQSLLRGLPTKPANKSTHSKGFVGGTIEAEAVPAHLTRRILREAIEEHLDMNEVNVMRVAEDSERDFLSAIAGDMEAGLFQP